MYPAGGITEIDHLTELHTCVVFFDPQELYYRGEETKVLRGQVTCPRSHS